MKPKSLPRSRHWKNSLLPLRRARTLLLLLNSLLLVCFHLRAQVGLRAVLKTEVPVAALIRLVAMPMVPVMMTRSPLKTKMTVPRLMAALKPSLKPVYCSSETRLMLPQRCMLEC